MSVNSTVSTIALRTFPIFQGLGDDRLAGVARCAMMRRVPRGSAVVHEGDRTDFVYFVLTGSLKVMVSDEDGREVILKILGQGEMFGEMGVLDDSPRSASVVAVSPSDLVTISKTDFKRLMQENFELAWHVMCNLAHRLRDADRKIESLALMDVYGRVARLLLEMAEEVDGVKVVRKKISKQDIAKMIGASREMVSRVMKDLGLRGLIEETDGGVILREKIYDL
ncbi:MAG TPA: cyclic nucleotide-binding domain-containing protein [Zoogloea sp.]|uniref:Crp/Fnr family transcriptional regulator n=1 Tax=Zoogloea sp. TaxID=49181 RepID=UPI002C7BE0E0|nr:cyclic nucleotide-binding domain-containing protein [Zoogloea sp.]HMV18287.1 cyclic nucleotide-binding domain-containing protein [Rhodocyclaceae bacterium]HMV64398.1 cyclic nucleotide-binding domain-containing protein [Rhodocyclaceae bacterium]HMW50523.1 cyclic nucleotide-binding domain-containing protein [Rhodocyclaceae bacterium]HMY50142.1 cyclic nucleotide-binding domain-containing protein [Rhodocyclaceae bacterium]HMZ76396.1 cyclic nucleotide-binding domain-containing protein [Rhodocycl